MAITKFETYQKVLDQIQNDMTEQKPGFQSTDYSAQFQAEFVLGFMSKQNKSLIASLEKIRLTSSSYGHGKLINLGIDTRNKTGFIELMNSTDNTVHDLSTIRTSHQNRFLMKLILYVAIFILCVTLLCFTAPAQIAMTLAFAIKAASALTLLVSSFAMGIGIYNYRKDRIPEIEQSIIKNWVDDTLITRSEPGWVFLRT